MDTHEAARIFGVAEHEIIEMRHDAEGWFALHHDMASHTQVWRHVPAWQHAGWWETAGAAPTTPPATDDPDGPGVDTDGDGVPEGSAAQILEWVGDDKAKAIRALEAETHRDKPRTTLTSALEKLTG